MKVLTIASSSRTRNGGKYNHYDTDKKVKMAQYACEHAVAKAA